jgi:hypothetical protein
LTSYEVCDHPIFIIGSPRSGTTILATSLSKHTALWTSGESDILYHLFNAQHIDRVYEEATARPYTWLKQESVTRQEFRVALGAGINALFTSRSENKRWIDQTPLYTLMADVLADMYPNSKFIHIMRDARKVVRSMMGFGYSRSTDSWVYDFGEACRTWREYTDSAMEFQQRLPERCMTVRNEHLADEPIEGFAELLRFLGLPCEPAPALYFQSNRINSSFNRLSSVNDSLTDSDPWSTWSSNEKSVFFHEAGDALLRYGFVDQSEHRRMASETTVIEDTLAADIGRVVAGALPSGATVLVVSRGDDRLCALDGHRAWHFPRAGDGRYAGYYPANSDEAIGHLEILRIKGAEYLLFPTTAFWWLDYYREFGEYLAHQYTPMVDHASCRIYRLTPPHPSSSPPVTG